MRVYMCTCIAILVCTYIKCSLNRQYMPLCEICQTYCQSSVSLNELDSSELSHKVSDTVTDLPQQVVGQADYRFYDASTLSRRISPCVVTKTTSGQSYSQV